jgi:hypothetical protein
VDISDHDAKSKENLKYHINMDVMTHTCTNSKRHHILSLHNSYNLTMNAKHHAALSLHDKKYTDIEFSVYNMFLE